MFHGYPFASFEEWGTLCAAAAAASGCSTRNLKMDQKHVSMSNFNHDERTLLSLNGSTKIQMQSEHMSGVHPSVVSRIVFPIT